MVVHNNKTDVVAHTCRKNDPAYLAEIKAQYAGIRDEKKMGDLLQKQDYIELLNHLWSETDGQKRLAWLEGNVGLQHPILLFEIAEEYYMQNPTPQTYVLKTKPFLLAGMSRAMVDAACTSDASVSAAAEFLIFYYHDRIIMDLLASFSMEKLTEILQPHQNQGKENAIAMAERFLLPVISGKENLPSPSWIFSHGMGGFTGMANSIPESDWALLRRQKAQQLLEEIKEEQSQ